MKNLQDFIQSSDDDPEAAAAVARQQAVLDTGRMVYEWRKAAGLSQQQLADAIGSKQESISRIERGLSKEGPKLTTLAAIAAACGQRLQVHGQPIPEVLPMPEVRVAWQVHFDAASPTDMDVRTIGGSPVPVQNVRTVRVRTMNGVNSHALPGRIGRQVLVRGVQIVVDDDEGSPVVLDNLQLELSDQLEDLIVQQHLNAN